VWAGEAEQEIWSSGRGASAVEGARLRGPHLPGIQRLVRLGERQEGRKQWRKDSP
jgi:hypothetical protein